MDVGEGLRFAFFVNRGRPVGFRERAIVQQLDDFLDARFLHAMVAYSC